MSLATVHCWLIPQRRVEKRQRAGQVGHGFEFAAEHNDKRDRGRDLDVRVRSELGSAQPCSDRERRADQDLGGRVPDRIDGDVNLQRI